MHQRSEFPDPETGAPAAASPHPARVHRSLPHLRLRGRLFLVLLTLAGLAGLSGGAGLWVINDIGRTIANFSEITSPLVEQSSRLRQSAQRARLTIFEALSQSRNDDQQSRALLEAFNAESSQGLTIVASLLKRAEFDADTELALQTLTIFSLHASEILDARKAEAEAANALKVMLERFDRQIHNLDALLFALATQSETRMSEREDRAKTLLQSSRATVDTLGQVLDETFNENYPIVQGVYKLMRYTALIHEAARSAINADGDVHLAQVERQIRQYLGTVKTLQNRVAVRLTGPAKTEFGKVRDGFSDLEKLLLADGGLLAMHAKGVDARRELRALRLTLAKAQNAYSDELRTIESSAERFNDHARTATIGSIAAANKTVSLIVAVALVLALGFAMTFAQRLVRPLTCLTADMRRLAKGDLDGKPAAYQTRDEIAEMFEALEVFRRTARRDQAFTVTREEEQRRKEAQHATVERHIREFDAAVMLSLSTFFQAANEMRATAEKMAGTADETSRQAATVTVAARETSQDVSTVAAAAEELSVSTGEISRQILHSASIADKALQESERTQAIAKGFAEAVDKVGNIVSLIQNVAQSTNLLALNATIEAARAGASGRGFAVVATEVKTLATQTAAATGEIRAQIEGIQGSAQHVVAAITEISATIREMNNASEMIGTATEVQAVTTQDIVRAVQETAQRTEQVTTSIDRVDQGAGLTGNAAAQVLKTADELSLRSEELRGRIEKFFSDLRAA